MTENVKAGRDHTLPARVNLCREGYFSRAAVHKALVTKANDHLRDFVVYDYGHWSTEICSPHVGECMCEHQNTRPECFDPSRYSGSVVVDVLVAWEWSPLYTGHESSLYGSVHMNIGHSLQSHQISSISICQVCLVYIKLYSCLGFFCENTYTASKGNNLLGSFSV